MAILAKLAKAKGVELGDYLQPQEVVALENALTDPKKHAAAKVMIKNLEKQMDAGKAKNLKNMLKGQFNFDI